MTSTMISNGLVQVTKTRSAQATSLASVWIEEIQVLVVRLNRHEVSPKTMMILPSTILVIQNLRRLQIISVEVGLD